MAFVRTISVATATVALRTSIVDR